jgi:hypothetical protein
MVVLKGYSGHEMATRKKIEQMIAAKQFQEAKELSQSFINSNKKRMSRRRHLLKATVRFWLTAMNMKGNV